MLRSRRVAQKAGTGGTNCAQAELAKRFQEGADALNAGSLDTAERQFRAVLRCGSNAGAYANLGVVYMRKQDWADATRALKEAARLAPAMTGVRLNLALVAFHRAKYEDAVPYLKSVVQEQPNSVQPAYLLGLSYFFTQQYVQASTTLQGIWASRNGDLAYLYVLGLAADKAGQTAISEKAWSQLEEIGSDTAQFHLLMGKALYNRGDPDKAMAEFEAADKLDPKLPFLHYSWGQAFVETNQYDQAKEQFLKDISVEPDIPYSYDELARVYDKLGDDVEAERNYRSRSQSQFAAGCFILRACEDLREKRSSRSGAEGGRCRTGSRRRKQQPSLSSGAAAAKNGKIQSGKDRIRGS